MLVLIIYILQAAQNYVNSTLMCFLRYCICFTSEVGVEEVISCFTSPEVQKRIQKFNHKPFNKLPKIKKLTQLSNMFCKVIPIQFSLAFL